MNASEIMTSNPETASAQDTIRDVYNKLIELDVRHIPIVDNGELVGIVSDRDFREHAMPVSLEVSNPDEAGARLEEPIGTIMHGNPVSVLAETDLKEVVEVLIAENIGAVAVVDEHDRSLVGIVSYVDVLRAVLPQL